VTRRISTIQRRTTAGQSLCITVEIAAAGMLWTWSGFRSPEWNTRRFWAAIASAHGERIDVDGVRHWFVGEPWQRCQAEHLRELGEIDGAEWRRFTRWRDAGLPLRYVTDESPDQRPTIVAHCCWS
jgi:hypothetical protein